MKPTLRARNFAAVLISNFGVQALRFFTMTILARRLGTQLFGVYNYMLLLVSYGFFVVEFGLKNLAIREIAQGRGSGLLIRQIFRIRAGLAIAAAALTVLMTWSAFGTYLGPALFIGLSLIVDAFLVDYVLIADEALVPQAAGNLIQAGLLFVACWLLVHDESDFLKVAQFFLLSHVAWIFLIAITAKKHWRSQSRSPSQTTPNKLWQTALGGAPFMVATLASGIFSTADLLLLGQFHYKDWLGRYSAAVKILGISLGIVNSLIASVQPRLARYSADKTDPEIKTLIGATTRFSWMFVAPTVLGCWIFGDALAVWIFGPEFASTGVILKPLSLAFAFWTLALAPVHLLFVSHHTKLLLTIVFANLAVVLLLTGGVLAAGHPELLAWTMALAQFIFMISTWAWYGAWDLISMDDAKMFLLPSVLLAAGLFAGTGAASRFAMATAGYLGGLACLRVWKQPWFIRVLGRG